MCPECGSDDVRIEPFDFGVCRETGYRDAGGRFICRACGASGNADDLGECSHVRSASETDRYFPATAGGALHCSAISLV
jgi:transposase-like protein